MLPDNFWEGEPDLDYYVANVEMDDSVAPQGQSREQEMRLLIVLYLTRVGAMTSERERQVFSGSRLEIRRLLGQWSDDTGPFTDAEVLEVRADLVRGRAMVRARS
ncbi:MAG: hypothetical protein OXG95_08705 [Chloroflexi bacterium]|nr:hypothetical protein [Chloroflexota bacterium]